MPDNGIISEDQYMYEETCEYLTEGPVSDPQSEGCEECLKIGYLWDYPNINCQRSSYQTQMHIIHLLDGLNSPNVGTW